MKKIFGTTLLLGDKELETIFGKFIAIVFQDVVLKTYIIALVFNNTWELIKNNQVKDEELFIRIHSSCVTSEMLCSQDCDCVEQLFGAMKKISEMNNGILFYLIQEGRGCGYISKARACQLVQYDEILGNNNITTFDAYKMLGLKYDYRSYHNIKEIIEILDISSVKFILLTNNPDKINGLKNLNINIIKSENIEYKPNPFNISYLLSKGKFGHDLHLLQQQKNEYILPFEPIKPFDLKHLDKYSRFIYVASYYLPIKNMFDWCYLPKIKKDSELYNLIKNSAHSLNENLYNINEEIREKYNIFDPLWFRVHLYYDITTNLDYVVLEYREFDSQKHKQPFIRIHSESIFDRFPLLNRVYHEKYKMSILDIVVNGYGYILLFYRDGRGSGLGYYLLNKDENGNKFDNHKSNIGIPEDTRDYDAILQLIEHHLELDNCQNCKLINSRRTIEKISSKLNKYNIKISENIIIDDGYYTILERINKINYYINKSKNDNIDKNIFKNHEKYIITGIGSSIYHGHFLNYFLEKKNISSKFEPLLQVYHNSKMLSNVTPIFISQGLSPTIKKLIEKINTGIIITANKNINLNKFKVIYIPHDNPDKTLARIIGPIMCFVYILKLFDRDYERKDQENLYIPYNKEYRYYLLSSSPNDKWLGIISNYLLELFSINVSYCGDFLNFAHGSYQISQNYDNNIFVCFTHNKDNYYSLIKKMLNDKDNIINVHSDNDESCCIIDWILTILNSVFHNIEELKNFNHYNWPGKDKQSIIYNY